MKTQATRSTNHEVAYTRMISATGDDVVSVFGGRISHLDPEDLGNCYNHGQTSGNCHGIGQVLGSKFLDLTLSTWPSPSQNEPDCDKP